MIRPKRNIADDDNQDRWLLTYADLITLLLALFIVMYAISQIDSQKFEKVSEALNGILKGNESILENPNNIDNLPGHGIMKIGNLKSIQSLINERFKSVAKDNEVKTEVTERGLVVHIMESALFDEGSAELRFKAMDILDIIYQEIHTLPNHIRIEGHTDDRDISTVQYPSNWELSAARASSVVRYLIDNYGMEPNKLSALGYGEYRPIKPNNTIENRAQNRRVDIVVLTDELSSKEPGSEQYSFSQNR